AQLKTRTKMFSPAPNTFGCEPNTNISFTDTAQPGSLPILNREAVHKAILFGLAIDGKIEKFSQFDRKSYFYPDSPRGFQITQFYDPIITGGKVTANVDGELKTFSIEHAHLEDDSGMLKHFSSFAGVDYNRAGVPLIEIVSDPCMRSAKDAIAYATAIRAILQYLGASDCNMEEGGMRMDVNISIRPEGSKELFTKTEIKNMNSFTNMSLAIAGEVKRQTAIYDAGETVTQSTLRFDLEKGETVLMRTKEMAADYRYFPEPDLPPITLTDQDIENVRANLPELPQDRYQRYIETLELTPYNATILVNDKALSDYFETALADCGNASALCNWITIEFLGRLKESGKTVPTSAIPARHIASLVNLIDTKKITGKIAKQVADLMVASPEIPPETIIQENPDFQPMTDTNALSTLIDKILADNPNSITEYRAGKDRAFNYLIGQIMKATRGTADPGLVNNLLKEALKNMP
ncbi:MAG: Asp-tRNA(Asn)/Glu-tRNA(Gln) amidotransferase subunit GatB, partial [Simkaniaceae bacterium]|nr:Asp-tRNA(Asn)/Glu-tRNA(Gln) amidotransferase subunit GatB [Simkaniaceae bacterium]